MIQVISFDLTGTLLGFRPSLGEICAETMRELGLSDVPAAKVFDDRKKQASRVAVANGFSPTSEKRSREYWRAMLWEIFAGTVPTALFPKAQERIYARLADASSWCLADGATEALDAARFLGLRIVALSNGDARWRNAMKKLGLEPRFDEVFLSSETGLAKPDPHAFENVCLKMRIPRDALLHVGDSLAADVLPAHACGAEAVWLTRTPDGAPPETRVVIAESLRELPKILQTRLCENRACTHFPRDTRNLLAALRGLPEEQTPNPATIVAKKSGSETLARKRARVEAAAFTTDREFSVPAKMIDELLRSRGIFSGSVQSIVRERWAEIVPANLATRCAPAELREGMHTLVVGCESSVIRQQLEFRKRGILKKIRSLPHCENISKIVFSNEFSS